MNGICIGLALLNLINSVGIIVLVKRIDRLEHGSINKNY